MYTVFQLLEPSVLIRARESDKRIVEDLLATVAKEYKDISGKDVAVKVDSESFLPADTNGGIDLLAQKGKIKISNTLESRLDLIASQLIPNIRIALFGRNPNRKFND